MNELTRYDQLLKDRLAELPQPGEDFAWAEMKKLLEDDDDDVVIVPPIRRGCGPVLWLVGVLLLAGLAWYFLKPGAEISNKKQNDETTLQQEGLGKKEESRSTAVDTIKNSSNAESLSPDRDGNTTGETISLPADAASTKSLTASPAEKSALSAQSISNDLQGATVQGKRKRPNAGVGTSAVAKRRTTQSTRSLEKQNDSGKGTAAASTTVTKRYDTVHAANLRLRADSTTAKPAADSLQKNGQKPVPDKKDTTANALTDSVKKKEPKQKQYSWGAGLAMNQLIPIGGQQSVPYNAEGRKGNLADYIPAVYLRFYRDKKWFIQSEFRYGAPQYDKETVYDLKNNTGPLGNIDTATRVLKTYYHQLPVSFNYYLLPNLSLGAGLVWNKFNSAVSEKQVLKTFPTGRPDSIISSSVFKPASDSIFSKSYFQGLLELQYSWKRFSIGARYTKGLSPYIRFTLPGGTQQQEKNESLGVFLRYEIWRKE